MKKLLGFMLALAMMASMAVPAMAVGANPEADYKSSYDDTQWDKGYDDGYNLGYGDAAAGRERKSLAYLDGSDYEDGKIYGYDVGYDDYLYEKEAQETISQAIRDAGGVAGQINVKLNDKCIAFPDAVPELKMGSTMVPVRALMEALGAKVTTDKNVVTIVLGTTSIQMTVGDTVATVEKNGTKEEVKLGAASYLKRDRVYIPLRFVSEVLGFQVKWDQDYQSVVIFDRTSIVKNLNERFSTANIFMQSQSKLFAGNWMTEGNFNVSVELIDSIDGNKTFTATGTSKTHSGAGAMTMEGTLDLSKFAGLLDSIGALSGSQDSPEYEMLKSYMKVNQFSMKFVPQGDYYLKSEIYDQIASSFLGVTLDKNKEIWHRMGHLDPTLLTAEGYTMGNYLYSMLIDPEISVQTPFMAYDTLMQTATQLELFMGNNSFKKQGENYVLSMNKDQLLRVAGEDKEVEEMLNSTFQELSFTLTFNKDGVYSVQGAVKLKVDGLGALMNLKMDQNGTSTDASGSMQFQMRNLFNMTMKAKSSASKTQNAPDTSIPKDAQIIDWMKILQGLQ